MGEKSWRWCSWMESSVPTVVMVLAVTALAINMIVSKMAMSTGTSFFILSVYSNALASLILFPCCFLFHSNLHWFFPEKSFDEIEEGNDMGFLKYDYVSIVNRSNRPPLTFSILCRIFLLASFGCLADIGSYAGINNSSPTLATELLNTVPAFTYILAIIFRMERLNLKKSSDISKSLGTLVSIAGASIVTLYKGPAILNKTVNLGYTTLTSASDQNWILGGILLAIAGFSTAAWSIVQTSILKMYPAEMIIVAIYCLFVTIQSTVVALIAEKDLTAWKLQAEMGLIAVLYAGIANITFRLYMMSWCLSRTGPLFVSLFNPLTVVISVVIGTIFFHEVLCLGSVAGALVLVIGFYAVIWGKAKESKMSNEISYGDQFTSHEVPLLHDRIEEA